MPLLRQLISLLTTLETIRVSIYAPIPSTLFPIHIVLIKSDCTCSVSGLLGPAFYRPFMSPNASSAHRLLYFNQTNRFDCDHENSGDNDFAATHSAPGSCGASLCRFGRTHNRHSTHRRDGEPGRESKTGCRSQGSHADQISMAVQWHKYLRSNEYGPSTDHLRSGAAEPGGVVAWGWQCQ